jgi:hypothetical protein
MDRLRRVLYHRVFPLLQEYFYNDWQSLRPILGTYDAEAKNRGFVESLDNVSKNVFTEEAPGYETPYRLQQYGVDELETVLRNTFGNP